MQQANPMESVSGPALVEAIEGNLVEALANFGRITQATVHDSPEITWFATGIPLPRFNGVVRTRLPVSGIDGAIEETLSHFRSSSTPMVWWTGPSTHPDNLGTRLLHHGLSYAGDTPGMAIDLGVLGHQAWKPGGLMVEQVNDEATLANYIHALVRGFGDPDYVGRAFFDFFAALGFGDHLPWRHYVGYLNGEPVACSTVFLGAGVAGIYNVTTVPEARGQRIGTAMTVLPLLEARTMGCHIGVLHSSPQGLNVYRRMGFREYCRFGSYVWLPDGVQSRDPQSNLQLNT